MRTDCFQYRINKIALLQCDKKMAEARKTEACSMSLDCFCVAHPFICFLASRSLMLRDSAAVMFCTNHQTLYPLKPWGKTSFFPHRHFYHICANIPNSWIYIHYTQIGSLLQNSKSYSKINSKLKSYWIQHWLNWDVKPTLHLIKVYRLLILFFFQ